MLHWPLWRFPICMDSVGSTGWFNGHGLNILTVKTRKEFSKKILKFSMLITYPVLITCRRLVSKKTHSSFNFPCTFYEMDFCAYLTLFQVPISNFEKELISLDYIYTSMYWNTLCRLLLYTNKKNSIRNQ